MYRLFIILFLFVFYQSFLQAEIVKKIEISGNQRVSNETIKAYGGIDTNKDCYISNIVKCRPPENRKPHKNEVSECIPWLEKQIALIKPKVVVLAGSTAVESYLQVTEPISKIRGKWIIKDDIKYMPIFHPSYLLRNPSKEKGKPKWLTWQDLKKVKEELNLT